MSIDSSSFDGSLNLKNPNFLDINCLFRLYMFMLTGQISTLYCWGFVFAGLGITSCFHLDPECGCVL